jgi:hypothetical protein
MTTGAIIYLSGALFFTAIAYLVLEYMDKHSDISFFEYTDKSEGIVYAVLFGVLWEFSVPIVIATCIVWCIYFFLQPIVARLIDFLSDLFRKHH